MEITTAIVNIPDGTILEKEVVIWEKDGELQIRLAE